jgi:hypothetical protein
VRRREGDQTDVIDWSVWLIEGVLVLWVCLTCLDFAFGFLASPFERHPRRAFFPVMKVASNCEGVLDIS